MEKRSIKTIIKNIENSTKIYKQKTQKKKGESTENKEKNKIG